MKFGGDCGKYAFPVHKGSILAKVGWFKLLFFKAKQGQQKILFLDWLILIFIDQK